MAMAVTLAARLAANSASWYGMHIAHLGVAAFVFGITMVKSYDAEKDLRLDVGQSMQVGAYDFRFIGLRDVIGPNYEGVAGRFEVRKNGDLISTMEPEKRFYPSTRQTMTEAAIDHGLSRDLYVSLGNMIDDRTWEVRAQVKPFINWIWLGCVIMALGGVVAIADRRYQLRRKRATETVPAGAGVAT